MKAIWAVALVFLLRSDSAVITFSPGDRDGTHFIADEDDEACMVNKRPIIGVLTQEQSAYLNSKYPENFTSYVAASYVKAIESSGARVVPIMIGKGRAYYKNLMSKLNGILFPGGNACFSQSGGYADAGQHIYEVALEMNAAGDHFPLFGTCLGFELLAVLAAGRRDVRVGCNSFGNFPIQFAKDYRSSRMFHRISKDYAWILKYENVAINAHHLCILDEHMESLNLSKDWRVLSRGWDENRVHFISSIEHKKYPFYGTQFHPEKPAFEWTMTKNYTHSVRAIKVNRYFMDFFVSECRRSLHAFSSVEEENEHLIYNYPPYFTGGKGSAFEQCYMFGPTAML